MPESHGENLVGGCCGGASLTVDRQAGFHGRQAVIDRTVFPFPVRATGLAVLITVATVNGFPDG